MSKISREKILISAGELFPQQGAVSFSIRLLAKHLHISPSLIYYYFDTEDELLLSMFQYLNRKLGEKRAKLPSVTSVKRMLEQRIEFQIDNQSSIVAVLKYYFSFRHTFSKFKGGFLPDKSSLHIEEVLRYGEQTGEFVFQNLEDDAKVITHLINGYLLEFYPYQPTYVEKKMLVKTISSFIFRALQNDKQKI
jgi:AcrR family transcriptional regulator